MNLDQNLGVSEEQAVIFRRRMHGLSELLCTTNADADHSSQHLLKEKVGGVGLLINGGFRP